MDWGIKVSKPGEDVKNAGIDNLFMDSTYPLLKIKQSGTGTLSVTDGGSDSDTITHNLGFLPKVFVYGQYYNVYAGAKQDDYRQYPIQQQIVGVNYSYYTFTVTTTQLIISAEFDDSTGHSADTGYFYYIFYDEQT